MKEKEITIVTRLTKEKDLYMAVYVTDNNNYYTWLFDRVFNTHEYDYSIQFKKQIDALEYFFEGYKINIGGEYEE